MGEEVRRDRSTREAEPPAFPVARRLWGLVRVEQVLPAQRATTVLHGEQAQVVPVQRWRHLPLPRGPVTGQVGVIRRCPARDQLVPNDRCPGELHQMGDVTAVVDHVAGAEDPPVVPELVEPAPRFMRPPASAFTGSPAHVSALSGPAVRPASGRFLATTTWSSSHPPRVPLPFGRRHPLLGHPIPPRHSAPLTIGLPDHSGLDPDGVSTFHAHETRPGWAPPLPRGQRCRHDR